MVATWPGKFVVVDAVVKKRLVQEPIQSLAQGCVLLVLVAAVAELKCL